MIFTYKLARRLAQSRLLALSALSVLVGSCAPGKPLEGGLEPPPDEVLAVQVFPDSVDLNPAEFVDFTAVGELRGGGNANVPVDWEAAGGTITADGRYTAGNLAGTYKVIGRHRNGKADSSTVVVHGASSGPVLTRINVTPSTAALLPGASQPFTATGVMSDGSSSSVAVTWTASGGAIDAGGLYTAPAGAGSYLVIATQQGGSFSDTAQVTVSVPPPTLTAVILTPATTALEFGRTQQFTAIGQLSDGSTTSIAITWTATGGTVNASGLYTAGSTAGTFRVIARSANGLADTSAVTITPPTITGITLTPATVTLQYGQTRQFSVSASLSNGGTQTNPAVTWAATGGAINSTGLYTAGATAGTFRVIATQQGGTLADTSAVTITAPTVTAITLTPATVTLQSGQTQQFSASATLSNGATQTNPAVTWAATGGTVNSTGLYTAGATAGTFRVIATQQGGTLADTSAITVTATAPTLTQVILTPASVSLATGATQQFAASGRMSDGSTSTVTVTYSATGGTITSGGLYTAGSTAGTFRVIATQQGGTLADTSSVTITAAPPTLTQVILTPATVSLAPGGTQQFAVSGKLSDGSTTSVTVTYSATGGTITSGGLYTAGSTTGSFRVIATQQGGTLADTSAVTIAGGGGGGTVLFSEAFADNNFASRGWYDGGAPPVVTYLGRQAAKYTFSVGQTNPGNILSTRHTLTPTTNVYLEFYVAFAANWVGSGQPYHPHLFYLLSNYDNALNGGYPSPADNYLDFYVELNHVSGQGERLYQALQDNRYVNPSYVYPANAPGENRSVCGANGPRQGDAQGWDAFADAVSNGYYSARLLWGSPVVNPANDQGWHKYAVYLQQNSVVGGIGQVDGLLSVYWDDVLQYTRVVMTRTGQTSPNNRAAIQFQQLIMGPYIGDGSPANQTMYISGVTIKDAP